MTQLIQKQFEGTTITTIMYEGKPCWLAKEVGAALGYANGGVRLTDNIRNDWREDLIEGTDFAVLRGKKLKEFRSLADANTESVIASKAAHALLLFETGLHMVLMKTNKEVGRRLRRFLVDEVMPQLVRSGRYEPEQRVAGSDVVPQSPELIMANLAVARHRQESLLRLVQRFESAGRIADDVADAYSVVAVEAGTGLDLSGLKPEIDDGYLSPTQIAERCDSTPFAVGRAISRLGLRGNQPGVCKGIINKAKGHNRTVITYLYSPKAVERIIAEVRADESLRLI